jgi:hypothetical protein
MTDQDTPQEPQVTPDASPPAGAQNTSSDENRVPQARFNAVLQEKNELAARLAALEAADKTRREAEMSELERAQAKAQESEVKHQQLLQQLESERKARLEDKRDSAVAQSLAAAGAIDADDLITVLRAKYANELTAILNADGTLDSDAIKALVDKVRTERAYAFQSGGPGSPSNRGGYVPTVTNTEAAALAKQVKEQYGYDLDAESLGKRIDMYKDIL